jgi:hypothetical protein
MEVEHAGALAGDDRRTGVDADDLDTVAGVEDDCVVAVPGGGGRAGGAGTDHGELRLDAPNRNLGDERRSGDVAAVDDG